MRRGGSTEQGGGPIALRNSWWAGAALFQLTVVLVPKTGDRVPWLGRHAPAVVDAGFNGSTKYRRSSPCIPPQTADDRVRRVDDHDGHGDVGVAIVGSRGRRPRSHVAGGRRGGDGVERTGEGSGSRALHLPIEGNGGIGGEGEALPGAGRGGGGGEAQFGKDVDREVAFTGAVRGIVGLEAEQERAFVGERARSPHRLVPR